MIQTPPHFLVLALVALIGACSAEHKPPPTADDADAGATVITRMACGSCHVIPGIEEADGRVGPSLDHFAQRRMIAGMVANTRSNLAAFLKAPQALVKGNVMPDEHLTDAQAHAAAAYLATLE